MSAISVVVAVYNAKTWLPRFIASLQNQTFKDFEVLLIDDASTDASAAVVDGVASADSRFKLIRLPQNCGCGVARNVGIRQATGETLCFADPDDVLPERSLEVRYAAYKTHRAIVRACHDEVLDDGTVHHHELRPQGLPDICNPAEDGARIGVNPFLCAHWAWLLPTNLLRRNSIFDGENMLTAEDIIMLTRLFFHVNRLVWIPDTVYYWMKHSDSLSNTLYTPEHYANYFQCCDVFYEEAQKNGHIRLADIFFNNYLTIYLAHLLWQASTGKSSETDVQTSVAAMVRVCDRHAVFSRCLPEMQKYPLRHEGLWRLWHILHNQHPSLILRLAAAQNAVQQISREAEYRGLRNKGWSQEVTFDSLDRRQGLLRARYRFCDSPPEECYDWNGVRREPAFAKNRSVFEDTAYTIFERILWLPLPQDDAARCRLRVAGRAVGLDHTVAHVRAAFAPGPLDDRAFPPAVRALRRLARSRAMRQKFDSAWLFIDRDNEADDNAEHLYRWVRREHPEINAWFVLNEASHDWPRLQAEGFRLIAHGSMEHWVLSLLCVNLVSSHMDTYIFRPVDERYVSDFPKPQFTCLQHGVIKDDLSNWLNGIPFDLFITTTQAEWSSIVADGTPYVMTRKEAQLTGLPRYDALFEPGQPENIVFVMPTWRADLVGKWDGKGQRREINQNFYASPYVATWKDVFDDARLKALLDKYGYRVVFFAHPCFEDYLEGLPFPSYVKKCSKLHCSMMDMIKRSKVMITDFSSIAYDMAYIGRPVLYYQTEKKADYTRSQNWVTGFFNYATMGFGPVCQDKGALLAALEQTLQTNGAMDAPYAERAEKTFAYHDRNNCQRVFARIVDGSKPVAPASGLTS